MPSPRRHRLILITLFLAALTALYIFTGRSSTTSSPFYTRTSQLMSARTAGKGAGPFAPGMTEAKRRMQAAKELEEREFKAARADLEARERDGEQMRLKEKVREGVRNAAGVGGVGGRVAGNVQHALSTEDEEPQPPSREDAEKEYTHLETLSPILIFSKSYCPYSAKGKRVMLEYIDITPKPHVIELDLLDGVKGEQGWGRAMQNLLREKTGRGTVPNVIVGGKSIGGGDDVETLWRRGDLRGVVMRKGAKKVKSVVVVKEPPKEEE